MTIFQHILKLQVALWELPSKHQIADLENQKHQNHQANVDKPCSIKIKSDFVHVGIAFLILAMDCLQNQ